jgi:hypothetical protein
MAPGPAIAKRRAPIRKSAGRLATTAFRDAMVAGERSSDVAVSHRLPQAPPPRRWRTSDEISPALLTSAHSDVAPRTSPTDVCALSLPGDITGGGARSFPTRLLWHICDRGLRRDYSKGRSPERRRGSLLLRRKSSASPATTSR